MTSSYFFFLLLFTVLLGFLRPQRAASFSFSFHRFPNPSLRFYGAAVPSGSSVRLVPPFSAVSYASTVDFGRKPSFSADLCFSISSLDGYGVALFVAPGNVAPQALPASPGVFSVGFDARRNRVGVHVGGGASLVAGNASAAGVALGGGGKVRSWVDFDGETRMLEVRLGRDDGKVKPLDPLLSYAIDLSGIIWREAMFVGVCSYNCGNCSQVVSLYSWSFRMSHASPYLMHSEPLDPGPLAQAPEPHGDMRRTINLPNIMLALAIGAACGAGLALVVVSMWSFEMERYPVAPVEDAAEFECIKIVADGAREGKNAAFGDKGRGTGSK